MTTNVGELNVKLSMSSAGLASEAQQATSYVEGLDAAVAKLKKNLEFEAATANLKLLKAAVPSMSSMGSQTHTAKYSDPMIQGLSEHVRLQDEANTKQRLALQEQGAALRLQLLTETEKAAIRKQADLDHLRMMREANTISEKEFALWSRKAGTLGLGNTGLDNNMNNRGFQGAMAAQQIGFGIQDFASQMANSKNMVDGLGRGVMAVSNNVQMLGAAFGPTALAATAIGGALTGLILPATIKWMSNNDAIEKQMDSIAAKMDHMAKRQMELVSLRNLDGQSAQDAAEQAKKQLKDAEDLTKVLQGQSAGKRNEVDALTRREAELAQKEKELEASPMRGEFGLEDNPLLDPLRVKLSGVRHELKAAAQELKDADKLIQDSMTKEQEARANLNAVVQQATQAKEAADRLEQGEKDDEIAKKQFEFERKQRLEQLETFGTDRQKLLSKQARELDDLDTLMAGSPAFEESMAKMKAGHAVELSKLGISETEKAMQKASGNYTPAGGVDVATREGVQAINRALSGTRTQEDVLREQLDVEKQQLALMEQSVRGEIAGPVDLALGPQLGAVSEVDGYLESDLAEMRKAEKQHREWDMQINEPWRETNPEMAAVIDASRARTNANREAFRNRMNDTLESSMGAREKSKSAFMENFNATLERARNEQAAAKEAFNQRMEQLRVQKEQLAELKRNKPKPVKVVQLNH